MTAILVKNINLRLFFHVNRHLLLYAATYNGDCPLGNIELEEGHPFWLSSYFSSISILHPHLSSFTLSAFCLARTQLLF
jgi:hypothetical protein